MSDNIVPGPWRHKVRCSATSKRTGEQCGQYCAAGFTTCKWHGAAAPQVIVAVENRREELLDKLWHLAPGFLERLSAIAHDIEIRTVTASDGSTVEVVTPRSADADVVRATKVILDKLLPMRVIDETGVHEERDLDNEIGELVREMDPDEVKRRLARLAG
ncbi:MAG: hypothetical protein ACRD0W_06845 [Acidimicrobiales bacterium]